MLQKCADGISGLCMRRGMQAGIAQSCMARRHAYMQAVGEDV